MATFPSLERRLPHFAGRRPPQRRRQPGELLWTIRVNNVTFVIGRRFILREEAIGWAEHMLKEIEKGLE